MKLETKIETVENSRTLDIPSNAKGVQNLSNINHNSKHETMITVKHYNHEFLPRQTVNIRQRVRVKSLCNVALKKVVICLE